MNNMIKTILAAGFCLVLARPLNAAEPAALSTPTVNALAAGLLDQGKTQEAYDLLLPRHAAYNGDVETAFLLGQCALKLNRPAEAAGLYEGILAKHKNLPRVRLELGRAYSAMGEIQKAKDQFLAVLGDSPPPMVGENIGKYMASMEAQKNWNARASFGYLSDSNVNAGPTAATVLMFGVPFQLSKDARETGGHGYTAGLGGGYLRKFKGDLALQSDAQYSRTRYAGMNNFDSDVLSGSAGLTLQKKAFILSMPLILESVRIGHARYNYALGLAPQVMVPLTERLVANAAVTAQKKRYYVGGGIRDGGLWSATAGAKYYYCKDGFLQASYRHAAEGTRADYLDNHSDGLNLGWYAALPYGLSLYLAPGVSYTRYAKAEAAFDDSRRDTQYTVVSNLSKDFPAAGLSAALGYTYTSNFSNIGLYEYERGQFTVQLSKAF